MRLKRRPKSDEGSDEDSLIRSVLMRGCKATAYSCCLYAGIVTSEKSSEEPVSRFRKSYDPLEMRMCVRL
jgi:hypothetical protein